MEPEDAATGGDENKEAPMRALETTPFVKKSFRFIIEVCVMKGSGKSMAILIYGNSVKTTVNVNW